MNAYYSWCSKEFNLLNVLSVLSMSYITSVDNIIINFNINHYPKNIYWQMLNFIPKVFFNSIDYSKIPNSDSIFEDSAIMNFVSAKNQSGILASFDNIFIKDILKINRLEPMFSEQSDLYYFNNQRKTNKVVKRIVKNKYDYQKIKTYVNKKYKINKDILWEHTIDQPVPRNIYVVNMSKIEGFNLFDKTEYNRIINENVLDFIYGMLTKCRQKEKYIKIAQAIQM